MASTDNDLRHAGWFFAAAGGLFLTGIMLAASIAPAYDYHGGKISDLGVIGETALLFNALLVIVGGLNVAGGWLLSRSRGGLGLLTVYLIAGVGAIGAGLLPLDTGTPHALFALTGFLFFNLEAIATARVTTGALRLISIVAGLVGLAYVVVMVIGDSGTTSVFGAIGHGGSERMIVYPAMLWLLALGGSLMTGSREPEARPR